ncbi:MAG: hypothetical protein ABWK01_00615 [Infirmifilum sp.]
MECVPRGMARPTGRKRNWYKLCLVMKLVVLGGLGGRKHRALALGIAVAVVAAWLLTTRQPQAMPQLENAQPLVAGLAVRPAGAELYA